MRAFPISDPIVLGQLRELERLAEQECREGSFSLTEILIHAAIGTLKVLPQEIAGRVRTNFYVGDRHVRTDDAGRATLWAQLSAGLSEDLDRLAADPALAQVDVATRPKTKADAILAACEELEKAWKHGGDMLPTARALEHAGRGTDAHYDGRELVRLLSKKRIPDVAQYRTDIYRRISHARIVGEQFHNRPSDS